MRRQPRIERVARRVTAVAAMVIPAVALAFLPSSGVRAATLRADPPRLTVGAQEGASTRLAVDFRAPDGTPLEDLDLRSETNYGSVTTPRETSPGRYEVTLTAPPTDMPRAVVVVVSPRGGEVADATFAIVPVSVRTTLSARTEPRARVTCQVGSRLFGPVEARRDGRFSLDIVLPPGTQRAELRITDGASNVARHEVSVPDRPHDPLLVTLDRYRLATDGTEHAWVHAFAFDAEGQPLRGARLSARATHGTVSSFTNHGDGVHLARYEPPKDGRSGSDRIEVVLAEGGARHEDYERVSLLPGPPASLELEASPLELVAGAGEDVALVATARDAAGNVLAGQPIRLHAERGELSEPAEREDGRLAASLAPPSSVESGSIAVKALLQIGAASSPPATIELRATPTKLPTSWRAFSLITARVIDAEGRPVVGEVLLFHLARGSGRIEGVAVTNEQGVAFVDFSADPEEEVVTIEAQSTSRPELRASVHVEKQSGGAFAIIDRPAQAAAGGVGSRTVRVDDEPRVLTASVVLRLAPGAPASLVASADPDVLRADGAATSTITATLTDANDNAIDTLPLAFAASRGAMGDPAQTGDGRWRATLTAPEGAGDGSVTVTVTEPGSGLSADVAVALEAGPAARLELVALQPTLLADGVATTDVVATLTDATGVAVPDVEVDFEVVRGGAGVGSAAPTDESGETVAVATAGTTAGGATIEARVAERGLSASVDLELLAVGPVVLELEALPARIAADGRERSEIEARLLDAFGDPMPGESVRFLHAGPGTIDATTASTSALGIARTWLSSREAGVARIQASSVSEPSLVETVEVVIEGGEIVADFLADEPTCEGEVTLRATTPEAVEWEWDWTGDGIIDASVAEPRILLSAGNHVVTLTVRDEDGREGVVTKDVRVGALPTAVATAEPALAPSGGSVRLDGSASEAADGGAVSHAWDLDGDGETDSSSAVVTAWSPEGDGEKVARLVVTDANGCSARTQVSAVFGEVPDVAVNVTVLGSAEVSAGSRVRYRIDWRNEGLHPATDVRLEAALDELLTFESVPPGGITLSPRSVRWELGDLPPGDTGQPGSFGSFEVSARVASDLPAAAVTLDHVATIRAAEPDADGSDDMAVASITAFEEQDVVLTLAPATPAPREAGEALSLTATLEVLSPFDVEGTSVALSWDSGLLGDFTSDRSAAVTPGTATIDLGTLPASSTTTIQLGWMVRDTLPSPNETAAVVARAAHVGPDPTPDNDSDRVEVPLAANPNLFVGLEAVALRPPAEPGEDVRYEIELGNAGTTRATSVTLTSRLTPGLVAALVANPDGAVFANDVLTFRPGALAPGESRTVTATVRLASPLTTSATSLENETIIDSAEAAIDPQGDNRATRTVAIDAPPDVWVRLTPPSSAAAGDVVQWQLIAGNQGLRPARDVVVELELDGALVAHENTSLPVTVANASSPHVARFELGTLGAGDQVSWTHSLRLATPQAEIDPQLVGAARVSSAETDDADAGNDVAGPATLSVRARPDLGASLSLSTTTLTAGESLEARPRISAGGDAPCAAGTVSLSWAGDTLSQSSPIAVPVGPLAVGDEIDADPVVLTAALEQSSSRSEETIVLDARCGALDDDATNDRSSVALTVLAAPALALELLAPPSAVAAGDEASFTLRWENSGTTSTGDISIALATADPSLLPTIAPLSLVVADLAPGESGSASITVLAAPTLPARSVAATLTANATATRSAGASATADVTLVGEPDLALLRLEPTLIPDPPVAGGRANYDVEVENVGTAPSRGASLLLSREDGLLVTTSSIPAGGSDAGGLLTWPLPDLTAGASWRRTISFELPDSFTEEETEILVDASVDEDFDANPANDAASTSFTVRVGVNLSVDIDLEVLAPPLRAGGAVRARVRVGNSGTKDATDVSVTVRMPPPLVGEVTTITPGGETTANAARWLIPLVAAGEPGLLHELTFRVRPVLPEASNEFVVDATVSADPIANPEQDTSDDTDSATVTALAASDTCVTLEAIPSPDPPANGGELRYVVAVENVGTTAADPLDVVLELEDDLLSLVDADGGTASTGRITWSGEAVAAGETWTRTVVTTLPASFPGLWYAVRARATATSLQDDGAGCSVESLERETTVSTISNLAITKTLLSRSEIPPRRGTVYAYRVEVVNLGQSSSPGAVITDEYPPEMSVVDAGGAADDGTLLTWTIVPPDPTAGFGPGDRWSADYQLVVRPDLDTGTHVLRNTATVVNDGQDAIQHDDTFVHQTTLTLSVDLVVEIRATPVPSPPSPGSRIEYDVSVTNTGSETSTSTVLTIDLGPHALLDGPSPGTGTGPIDVDLADVLPGEVVRVDFAARSLQALPSEVNPITVTASASSFETDADSADNSDSVTHEVRARADLRSTLTGTDRDGAPLEAGDVIDFELTLENREALIATGVVATVEHDASLLALEPGSGFTEVSPGVLEQTLASPLSILDPPTTLAFSLRVASPLPSTSNALQVCGSVAADPADAFPDDDRDCAGFTAVACPELRVAWTLVAPTDPATPGTSLDGTLTVENVGTTGASAVRVEGSRDPVTTTRAVSTDFTLIDGSPFTVDVGDLPAGATATGTITIDLAPTMPTVDTVVTSTACATAAEDTCSGSGACAAASVTVRADVDAWVTLTLDPSGEVAPADELEALVTFGNDGTAPASDPLISLDLPDGLLVLESGGGRVDGGVVLFEGLADITPGTSDARSLLLRVADVLPAEVNVLPVVATISHARPDAESDPSDDVATAEVTARASADLAVTLVRTSEAPTPDGFVTYRADWENVGSTAARDATLTVTDDGELLLVTGQAPGELGRTFDLGDVAAGDGGSQSLQYRVKRILPAPENELVTSVAVATTTTDSDPGNDTASVSDTVLAEADVAVTLALDTGGAPAEPCGRVTATLSWTNGGNTAATDVELTLSFDPTLVNVVDPGSGSLDATAGTITWVVDVAEVGPGGGFSTQLDVACVLPATSNVISFEANAVTPTPDADPTNDASTASITVEACQDVVTRITSLTSSPDPAEAAGTITLSIEAENVGNTAATGVVLVGRWSDAAAVESVESASPGATANDASSLAWTLARMEVGAAPVVRTFTIQLAETFPAFENPLTLSTSVSALECDIDAASNADQQSIVVFAAPDLVLSTTVTNETSGTFPARAFDVIRYDHVVSNAGASPGEGVRVTSPWPTSQLDFEAAGPGVSAGAGTVLHERGIAGLAPGDSWASWASFVIRPIVPPPVFQLVERSATADEAAFGLARDAAPSDNSKASAIPTCFLSASIVSLASGSQLCLGSSVTLRAEPVPEGAWLYAWSADSGSFTNTTGSNTTYTPPEAAGSYTVLLSVTDPASGCSFDTTHVVNVTSDCPACRCQAPKPNPQYDGDFERLDVPGSRAVQAGETVALRVRIKASNNSRSAFLVSGPGGTTVRFSGGGATYVAHLPHDIYVECQNGGWIEFAPATVPSDMPPGAYSLDLRFVTRDDCGEIETRDDGSGGDRITVEAPTGASVEVRDWGPVRTQEGTR